jgi:hypothetical protein
VRAAALGGLLLVGCAGGTRCGTAGAPATDGGGLVLPENGPATAAIAEAVAVARRGGKTAVDLVPPSPAEAQAYGAALVGLLSPTGVAPEGFEVAALSASVVVVREQSDRRQGGGVVVLRRGPARPVVVQVPHSFFDQHTLPIGIGLFDALQARALLANTVHRYRAVGGTPPADGSDSPSDVAHVPGTRFQAAHEALLGHDRTLLAVQLHGFEQATLTDVDVVVSAAGTTLDPVPVADLLARALRPAVVKIYPTEVRQLGGTTNRQALASRRLGAEMLHLEMSLGERARLADDATRRGRLAGAIASLVPAAR